MRRAQKAPFVLTDTPGSWTALWHEKRLRDGRWKFKQITRKWKSLGKPILYLLWCVSKHYIDSSWIRLVKSRLPLNLALTYSKTRFERGR